MNQVQNGRGGKQKNCCEKDEITLPGNEKAVMNPLPRRRKETHGEDFFSWIAEGKKKPQKKLCLMKLKIVKKEKLKITPDY